MAAFDCRCNRCPGTITSKTSSSDTSTRLRFCACESSMDPGDEGRRRITTVPPVCGIRKTGFPRSGKSQSAEVGDSAKGVENGMAPLAGFSPTIESSLPIAGSSMASQWPTLSCCHSSSFPWVISETLGATPSAQSRASSCVVSKSQVRGGYCANVIPARVQSTTRKRKPRVRRRVFMPLGQPPRIPIIAECTCPLVARISLPSSVAGPPS